MGGNSENIFEAQRDSTVWEFQKDRFDINFKSSMGALGATYTKPVGKRAVWRTALAYSILDSERTGERLDEAYQLERVEEDQYWQSKFSIHTSLNFKYKTYSIWQIGIVSTQQSSNFQNNESKLIGLPSKGDVTIFQPYINWRIQLIPILTANFGLRLVAYSFSSYPKFEPRASFDWQVSEKRSLSFAYGLHSQLQQPELFYKNLDATYQEVYLFTEFTKSHHFVLGYRENISKSAILSAEIYYQSIFDVPISRTRRNSFSALNLLENLTNQELKKGWHWTQLRHRTQLSKIPYRQFLFTK